MVAPAVEQKNAKAYACANALRIPLRGGAMQSACKVVRLRGGGSEEEEEEGMPPGFDFPGAFVARSPCWFGNGTSLPSGSERNPALG